LLLDNCSGEEERGFGLLGMGMMWKVVVNKYHNILFGAVLEFPGK